MRRTIAMLCVLALLVCAACTETQNSEDVSHVSISVEQVIAEDASTKATIVMEKAPQFYWQDTDEVGIFPDKGGYQLGFSLEGQGGKKTGTFDGGGWAMRSDAKYSTYYPFDFDNRSSSHIPVSYLGQKQTGDNNMNHIGDYWFCAATPTASENGKIYGIDMEIAAGFAKENNYKLVIKNIDFDAIESQVGKYVVFDVNSFVNDTGILDGRLNEFSDVLKSFYLGY